MFVPERGAELQPCSAVDCDTAVWEFLTAVLVRGSGCERSRQSAGSPSSDSVGGQLGFVNMQMRLQGVFWLESFLHSLAAVERKAVGCDFTHLSLHSAVVCAQVSITQRQVGL